MSDTLSLKELEAQLTQLIKACKETKFQRGEESESILVAGIVSRAEDLLERTKFAWNLIDKPSKGR